MKIYEIDWTNGNKYLDKYGYIWMVNHKDLVMINKVGRTEYITDGRIALGTLLEMDFIKTDLGGGRCRRNKK